MPSGQGAGTNPIHNKQKKKATKEVDEDDLAYQKKQQEAEKARKAAADQLKGKKGPLKMGGQGIKGSGKK